MAQATDRQCLISTGDVSGFDCVNEFRLYKLREAFDGSECHIGLATKLNDAKIYKACFMEKLSAVLNEHVHLIDDGGPAYEASIEQYCFKRIKKKYNELYESICNVDVDGYDERCHELQEILSEWVDQKGSFFKIYDKKLSDRPDAVKAVKPVPMESGINDNNNNKNNDNSGIAILRIKFNAILRYIIYIYIYINKKKKKKKKNNH